MIVAKGFLIGIVLGAGLLALCLLSIAFPALVLLALGAIALTGVVASGWLLTRPEADLPDLKDKMLHAVETDWMQALGALLAGSAFSALLAGWWIGSTLTSLNQILSP